MSKIFGGIETDFRPSTYFWAQENGIQLSSDIAGAERRRLYKLALERGGTSLFLQDEDFSSPHLDPALRQAWGSFHPSHLGGEFLPRRRNQEVEIARIVIDSTTRDVTCVYARRGKNRIYYSVVDEYGGDTLSGSGKRSSVQPLTLTQLVDFFLSSWDLILCLDWNFQDEGHNPRKVHRFVLSAESDFYPEFEDEVRRRIDCWLETVADKREHAEED